MFGFNDNTNVSRTGHLFDCSSDLESQVFLYLQATRKHVHDASHFGQSQHIAIGDVSDVRASNEGQ